MVHWRFRYEAEVKRDIMQRGDMAKGDMAKGDMAKYAQTPDLGARLLATGNAEIIKDTTNDAYWGIVWAGRILYGGACALRAGAIDPV